MIGIDLGSNTLRALEMSGDFRSLKSVEFIVGSARNLRVGGKLDANAKQEILNSLQKISQIFSLKDEKVVAVATEAFRMASDSEEFFKEIKAKFGINFRVISGEEESKFITLAVKKRLEILNLNFKNSLIIDLGGASTEVSFGENFRSFKLGILRFYNEFKTLDRMLKNVDFATQNLKEFISCLTPDSIILTSGVPTTLAALKLGLNYQNYNSNLVNGASLEFSDFDKFEREILALNEKEAEILVGKDRQILVVAGILLLKSLLKDYKNRNFITIDDGLREGILIDEILKRG